MKFMVEFSLTNLQYEVEVGSEEQAIEMARQDFIDDVGNNPYDLIADIVVVPVREK